MANWKNDLFCLPNPSKQARLHGGENGDGRWGWFKTAKHRFGLHRFGQCYSLGVYRWLVLFLYFGALGVFINQFHWSTWLGRSHCTNCTWIYLPANTCVQYLFLYSISDKMIPLAHDMVWHFHISRCRYGLKGLLTQKHLILPWILITGSVAASVMRYNNSN